MGDIQKDLGFEEMEEKLEEILADEEYPTGIADDGKGGE